MHDVIIIALCAVIDRKLTPHMTLTLKSLTMTSTLCKLKRTQAYMYEQFENRVTCLTTMTSTRRPWAWKFYGV